jgi:predicted RNA-binding protein YlxR (DUF448 family)
MSRKHIPMRTCVQCREVRPKRELVRIVRTPQGTVEIDARGKAAGSGAYLCRNRACWEKAIPKKQLDHALKTQLSPEDKMRLMDYGQQLDDLSEGSEEKGEEDSLGG